MPSCPPQRIYAFIFTLFVFSISSLAHADFSGGLNAYEAGDYDAAITEILPLAEQGNALAQTIMGTMYSQGQGMVQNYTEAVRWYRLSAEQGNSDAQALLGIMYIEGHGVQQNIVQGLAWIKIAESQGNENARELGGSLAEHMTEVQVAEASEMAKVTWQAIPDEDRLIYKNDTSNMFQLSLGEWIQNLTQGKEAGVMDYTMVSAKEYAMSVRQKEGLLVVTPSYRSGQLKPWKLTVRMIFDTPPYSATKRAWSEEQIHSYFKTVMNQMNPEYSVIGHMEQKSSERTVVFHLTIFPKGQFKYIDEINAKGRACYGDCLNS